MPFTLQTSIDVLPSKTRRCVNAVYIHVNNFNLDKY